MYMHESFRPGACTKAIAQLLCLSPHCKNNRTGEFARLCCSNLFGLVKFCQRWERESQTLGDLFLIFLGWNWIGLRKGVVDRFWKWTLKHCRTSMEHHYITERIGSKDNFHVSHFTTMQEMINAQKSDFYLFFNKILTFCISNQI